MNPVELMIYAASWQLLLEAGLCFHVLVQGASDAAQEVVRAVPLTRDEYESFIEACS